MKKLYLPEATNDTVFFVISDISPENLLQLGIIIAVITAIVIAVVYRRKKK